MDAPSKSVAPDLARRGMVLAMLAASAGCSSRREPAPAFSYTLLDGSRHDSALLRGQVVLVNFWATSCSTCIKEMPQIAATHLKYSMRGLQTLAVAMSYDPPAAVSDYATTRALPFGVVIDNTGAIAKAFVDLQATPTTYLIDKRGALVRRWVGEPDFAALHRQVEALLAEPA